MILELLTLASLLRVDPAGDAYGAGDLIPPSAAIYADLSPFDLIEVEVGGSDTLTVRIRVAGIPDPGGLPNGLTLPVIDVYLDLAEGGASLALPGVGMALPDGHGWEVALRVHGDGAFVRRADDPDGPARPVTVVREDDEITLITGLPVPDAIRDVQAVTGVYDPFSADGWRPIAPLPSPWAFSSETPAPPVVDVLADRDERQRAAIRAYVLPTSRPDRGPVGWIVLMLGGLGVAAAGLWLRRRVPVMGGPEASADASAGASAGAPSADASSTDVATPVDEPDAFEPPDAADTAEGTDDADAADDARDLSHGSADEADEAADTVPVYRIGRAARTTPRSGAVDAADALRPVEPLALEDLSGDEDGFVDAFGPAAEPDGAEEARETAPLDGADPQDDRECPDDAADGDDPDRRGPA